MTIKQQAFELVRDMYSVDVLNHSEYGMEWDMAMQCALISVKNKYHSNRELLYNLKSSGIDISEKVYLSRLQGLIDKEKEIIKEIEKL